MSTPAISVIVPVYGVEQYIEACLRSIADQTFRDFELILVDDGSKDRSIDIAREYLETTALSWRVLRQENQGQGPARDTGIRAAQGSYVICIDSDDIVSPEFLSALYTAAEKEGADVSFCGFQTTKEGKSIPPSNVLACFQTIGHQEMLTAFLCRTLIPILPAMLMRRSMLLEQDISSYPGCRYSEDIYLIWLIFSASQKVTYTKQPLYQYVLRAGSTMSSPSADRVLTGYRAICELVQDPRLAADFPGREYLLPRWVLGALRGVGRYLPYGAFLGLAEQMDFRRRMKAMSGFPERKARILAALLRTSPRLFCLAVRLVG